MGMALEQARKAFEAGEFPVGCVIVYDGQVIAAGGRTGTAGSGTFFNEIDHAEIRAIKGLEKAPKGFDPARCVLYCTMEPCLMCFAAIILAGIKTIVYAYEDPMGGGTGCDLAGLAPLYARSRVRVKAGLGRQKSLDLFYKFFNNESNRYWKGSLLETYTLSAHAAGKADK